MGASYTQAEHYRNFNRDKKRAACVRLRIQDFLGFSSGGSL